MNGAELNSNATSTIADAESVLSRNIKFSILIILEPPALVCNVFLVYYLTTDKTLRSALHHHVILLLLITTLLTNLIEIPYVLHYLRYGLVISKSSITCLLWQWCDYLVYGQANVLMMWASFERHILVFHSRLLGSVRRRLLIHYLPLLLIVLYLTLFYFTVIFLHPCEKHFDFTLPICGQPCFTEQSLLSLYDLFVHSWLPLFLIVVLSFGLILRVVYSKRRLNPQNNQWRRYRRMVLQLWSISSLYLVCMGPYFVVEVIDLTVGLSDDALYVKNAYLFYMYWLLALLLPFVCLGCLPEVINKFQQQLKRWTNQPNLIVPIVS